ncbi:MAG: hypothetical protein RJS97_08515 [Parvibaculaceae bacterium]
MQRPYIHQFFVAAIVLSAGFAHADLRLEEFRGKEALVMTLGEYKTGGRKRCANLPSLYSDVQAGKPLTPEEFKRLAGDAPAFGLSGMNRVYVSGQDHFVSVQDLLGDMGPSEVNFTNKHDDFPIVCGVQATPAVQEPTQPADLAGLFEVTKSGLVLRFEGESDALRILIEQPNKAATDAGITRNWQYATARYDSNSGILTIRQRLLLNARTKAQCGDIYGKPEQRRVRQLVAPGLGTLEGKWELRPLDEKVCVFPRTSSARCAVVSCDEYDTPPRSLLMVDEESALNIGSRRGSDSRLREYTGSTPETVTVNRNTATAGGGVCGDQSCYQQAAEQANDYLADQFWR